MTVMNGMIDRRCALLWSDTACWHESLGDIACYVAKAVTGLTWPFAITSTVNGQDDPQRPLREVGEA